MKEREDIDRLAQLLHKQYCHPETLPSCVDLEWARHSKDWHERWYRVARFVKAVYLKG